MDVRLCSALSKFTVERVGQSDENGIGVFLGECLFKIIVAIRRHLILFRKKAALSGISEISTSVPTGAPV